MAEQVQPSIRFCSYNLGDEDGEGEEGEQNMEELAEAEGASEILRSKLAAVMNESRAKRAQNFTEIEVMGESVPIKSEKVRISILSALQQLDDITLATADSEGAPPSDALLAMYDNLFVAFNDGLEGVRTDLRQAAKDQSAKSAIAEAHLQKLQGALFWGKMQQTTKQKLLLVARFKAALGGASTGGKRSSPEDVVRLYDSVLGSLEEMRSNETFKADEGLACAIVARIASAKAFRCFYVAESYGAAQKWREAQALYGRTTKLLHEAMELTEQVPPDASAAVIGVPGVTPDIGVDQSALAELEQLVEGAKARAHAQGFLAKLRGGESAGASAELSNLSLDGAEPASKRPKFLLEHLKEFDGHSPEHLIPFPPEFETVPCKPLLFDIARNHITFPDLSDCVKAKGGVRGYLGSWFARS